MRTDICTLFEGDYHHGLAALINSLVTSGYQGRIWCGYRGPLPDWSAKFFNVGTNIQLHFIEILPGWHLTHCKPKFMLDLLESEPNISTLFYFDPDIFVHCKWGFFEQWASEGIALCGDINYIMPTTHPVRMIWKRWLHAHDLPLVRDFDYYFNGGFLSVSREQSGFLSKWHTIIQRMETDGIELSNFGNGGRDKPFAKTDQDALNMAVMVTSEALSMMGPEGMDFAEGGFTMAHAAGATKPWKKSFALEAVGGRRPTRADREYIKSAAGPVTTFSSLAFAIKKMSLALGIAIGRFIRS